MQRVQIKMPQLMLYQKETAADCKKKDVKVLLLRAATKSRKEDEDCAAVPFLTGCNQDCSFFFRTGFYNEQQTEEHNERNS